MSNGWIKVHRQIQTHWLYTEKREFSPFEAWVDILLNVNHADAKVLIQGTLYEVKRGESINSLDTWAKRWNWGKSKVRRFLKTLENDKMIVLKNETKTTRLTVCNYDSYQDERNANETQTKRSRNADETLATPNKNDKNVNNEQETPQTPKGEIDEAKAMFDLNCKHFIRHLNEKTGRSFKPLNDKNKAKFKKILQSYTVKEIATAINNAVQSKHHIDSNFRYLTPEFFTRPDKIDMYAFQSEKPKEYTGENAKLINHINNYYNVAEKRT